MNRVTILCRFLDGYTLFAEKSAKVRRLKDKLAECKSEYANVEAMAAKV
jgi:hypothetical protein